MSSLSEMLFGKAGEMRAFPTMSPQQQALFSQLLSGLGGPLGSGLENLQQILSGSPEAFKAFEAPMMRQFNEQIIPGIAERFSGAGAGAQSSSAFQNALGQAGTGLSERLASMKAGLQQNALGQLSSLLGMGTQTPTFQWQQMPGSEGALSSMFGGIGSGFGSGLGGLFGKLFGFGG